MSESSALARLGTAAGGLVLLVVSMAGAAGAGVASILGGGDSSPSTSATTEMPAAMLALYQQAASSCPGLPWTLLAAIGTVESDNGTSNAPGVQSGANSAGAEGPMQFEPATFAEYDQPIPSGGASPPSPYDAADAVYAAARDLCANGAENGADLTRNTVQFAGGVPIDKLAVPTDLQRRVFELIGAPVPTVLRAM